MQEGMLCGKAFLTYDVTSHKSFNTEPQNIDVGLWEDSQLLEMRTIHIPSMLGFVALFWPRGGSLSYGVGSFHV